MNKNTLFQVSTLSKFANKGYDGELSIKKMLKYGNVGFGTFDRLNGEMMIKNGEVFRAKGNCIVEKVQEETTPFATIGTIEDGISFPIDVHGDINCLKDSLNGLIKNQNKPIISCISGIFKNIEIHSVWPQVKPYNELKIIVAEQKVYRYHNIKGSLIGVRCPKSKEGINVVGWHFHFISEDYKYGGHVNQLSIDHAKVEYEIKDSLEII